MYNFVEATLSSEISIKKSVTKRINKAQMIITFYYFILQLGV